MRFSIISMTTVECAWDYDEDGWLFDTTDTRDVLESLAFDCHPDLFEDIAKSFVHDEWVETACGFGRVPHTKKWVICGIILSGS